MKLKKCISCFLFFFCLFCICKLAPVCFIWTVGPHVQIVIGMCFLLIAHYNFCNLKEICKGPVCLTLYLLNTLAHLLLYVYVYFNCKINPLISTAFSNNS